MNTAHFENSDSASHRSLEQEREQQTAQCVLLCTGEAQMKRACKEQLMCSITYCGPHLNPKIAIFKAWG